MFKSENGKIILLKYFVTYDKFISEYADDLEELKSNKDVSNLEYEEVTLSEDQLSRYLEVENIPFLPLQEVDNYVLKREVSPSAPELLKDIHRKNITRDILSRKLDWDSLNDSEIETLKPLFNSYSYNIIYKVGDIFSLDNQLYKVLQSHTSQEDWNPSSTPALYKPIAPPNIIPEWIQPTGAQDAYVIGDKVTFEGIIYESLVDGNTWSPTAYPGGWKTV